jgi:hypothetical protein
LRGDNKSSATNINNNKVFTFHQRKSSYAPETRSIDEEELPADDTSSLRSYTSSNTESRDIDQKLKMIYS